ncbi:MAG: hypothetical protein DMG25_13425 [Acidobacteria bacterium]|nr:MAG: hypothetical protein DMG25_13425 [Acidobacteriota bacterium]
MEWVFGGLVLVAFGAVLRRVLRMNSDGPKPGPVPLGLAREAIYRPIALELETQAAILGISLNDAFEERDSGHSDNAWCLVHLSTSEWGRLAEIVVALLNTVNEYMPLARVAVPVRSLATQHFKSRIMIELMRTHELVQQLVFRSKLRFQLHIRTLRRAAETVTADFRHEYHAAEDAGNQSPDLWRLLDLEAHDFDLITKETLLAFRAFLPCLRDSDLAGFAAEIKSVMPRGVRTVSVAVER